MSEFKSMTEEEVLEECLRLTRTSNVILKARMQLRKHLSDEMKFRLEELTEKLPFWQEE